MAAPWMAIAQTAANIGSNIFNVASQRKENRRQRDFSREMYDRQHQDNLAMWHKQNEYNTPAQQMSRFTDAGLNPHLIYGQTNTAAPVQSSSTPQGPNTQAPKIDFDPASSLAAGLNLQMMNEQIRSQRISNDMKALELEDEKWYRQNHADVEMQGGEIVSGESMYRQMKSRQLDITNQSLTNAVADERRINSITGQNISQTQLQNIRQQLEAVELELAKKGIFKGDQVYDRLIMDLIDDNVLRSIAIGSPAAIGTIIKTVLDRKIGRKVIRK